MANLPKRDDNRGNRKRQREIKITNRTPEHPILNTKAKAL